MSDPGWHADQHDPHLTRYWDGTRWTQERVWDGTAWTDRSIAPAPVAPDPTPAPQQAFAPAPQQAFAPDPTPAPQQAFAPDPQPGYAPDPQQGYAQPDPQQGYAPQPQPAYAPQPQPGYGPPPTPQQGAPTSPTSGFSLPSNMSPKVATTMGLLVGGGLLGLIGTFGPWEKVEFAMGYSMEGNSPTTAPALVIIMLVFISGVVALGWQLADRRLSRLRCIGMTVLLAILWLLPVAKFINISNVESTMYATDKPGWGLYLTLFSLVLLTIATVMRWINSGSTTPSVQPAV